MEGAMVLADEAGRPTPSMRGGVHAAPPPREDVVEASVQVAKWLLARDQSADIPGTMGRTLTMLCQPA
jgi:hypothetical protein